MKRCTACGREMKELKDKTPEGIPYRYYKCKKCGEEIVDMKQLHTVASRYRSIKRYNVTLSKWGLSLGMRIPKEIVEKYKLKKNEQVVLIPEEEGLRVIPAEG